jgi:cell shape-determining protein MreC
MTKMSYLPGKYPKFDKRGVSNKKRNIILVSAVVLFLVLIFAMKSAISQGFGNGGAAAWNVRSFIGEKVSSFFTMWQFKDDLMRENENLKYEIKKNEIALIQNKLLLKENSDLRALFGETPAGTSTILVSVLARPPESPYDTLILSAGSDRSVKENDRVFAGDNLYLGKIVEVFPHSSKALLLSSPDQKWNVNIGSNAISAIAKGMGLGNFVIELPRETDVVQEDFVTLSGSDDLLGTVYFTEANSADSFKKIFVRSPFNINELKWVTIKK